MTAPDWPEQHLPNHPRGQSWASFLHQPLDCVKCWLVTLVELTLLIEHSP